VIDEHSPFSHFDDRAKRVMVLARQKADELSFTPTLKAAIVEAVRQANLREDDHLGTGHLLLGVLQAGGEPLTRKLSSIGVTLQAVSDKIGRHRRDS
jgi:ATP-dependent Clp protease ATP-binding subunit ClpA